MAAPYTRTNVKGIFTTTVQGKQRVLDLIRGAKKGVHVALSKFMLEDYFLKKTVERFAPKGSNPNAQRAPDGKFWAKPSAVTIQRRKHNTTGVRQALVDSGKLRSSIDIVKRLPQSVRATGGTGTFSIGVRGAAREYAFFQHFGGTTPQGKRVPPRPFLGISKTDAKTFELSMVENIKKHL